MGERRRRVRSSTNCGACWARPSGKAIQDVVQNANAKPATGLVATLIGVVTLLFGASGVFGQSQTSLNTIWGVQPKPGRGVIGIIQDRILSFGFILVVGFLLLVSLLLTVAIALVGEWSGGMVPGMETLAQILNSVLSLALITLLFAMIFKFLPDAKIAWHDVWIGAFITATLFTVGKFALGLYLGKSGVGSSYGAAGSLIVLLLWVYYSSQILFFGAEFTQVYANRFGSHVAPADNVRQLSENTLIAYRRTRLKLLAWAVEALQESSCYFTCPETCFVISNMVTCFLPPKTALRASSALISVFFFAS